MRASCRDGGGGGSVVSCNGSAYGLAYVDNSRRGNVRAYSKIGGPPPLPELQRALRLAVVLATMVVVPTLRI